MQQREPSSDVPFGDREDDYRYTQFTTRPSTRYGNEAYEKTLYETSRTIKMKAKMKLNYENDLAGEAIFDDFFGLYEGGKDAQLPPAISDDFIG